MIPGSLTTQEFEARRDEFTGKTVVAYCTVRYNRGAGCVCGAMCRSVVPWLLLGAYTVVTYCARCERGGFVFVAP